MKNHLMKPRVSSIDIDGHIDEKGIEYVGCAQLQSNGVWYAMAIINGKLRRIEVNVSMFIGRSNDS